MIFQPFPKLARLSRGCVITEKLDGTNAQIVIERNPTGRSPDDNYTKIVAVDRDFDGVATYFNITAGSRTRFIKPGKTTDNYGFAAWVWDHAEALVQLGEGHHYGEWYGQGIQRGYGLDHKRFALFDTSRYVQGPEPFTQEFEARTRTPDCVHVVPELYRGTFNTMVIGNRMTELGLRGSIAAPGFMNPEGIVVYHTHAKVAFKQTFDDKHKEAS